MESTRVLLCITLCVVPAAVAPSRASGQAPAAGPAPFTVGIELPSQIPVSAAVERSLQELGIGYVNYYLRTARGQKDRPESEVNRAMLDLCGRLGLDFSIATFELDPLDESVREAVRVSQLPGRKGRFRGVVFDELEHIRLLHMDRPLPLADYPRFSSVADAYEKSVQGFEKLRRRYQALGSPAVATHVFPVLLHVAGQAGFTVCPKICKETYSPVSFAIGLGAARQYGTPLWADCDLWYYDLVPGHPPEELRSNLLLAYWLGADLVYVEGAGYNLFPAGEQGVPFSLMNPIGADRFQLTPHGEVLRWFARQYVPAHPRPWTFRDVRPDIAIVRMDDTCWGQRYSTGFTRGLYGTERLASTADSEAWFSIWNVLTCGATGREGITYFRPYVGMTYDGPQQHAERAPTYLTRPRQAAYHKFFAPLHGAVVYDHRVGYDTLQNIPLIFLTGLDASETTQKAVHRCVSEGAVCVAWGPLARRIGFSEWTAGVVVRPEGKGKWVLTDDFGLDTVFQQIWHLVGRNDEIRYRFGRHEVALRAQGENDVSVEVDGAKQ